MSLAAATRLANPFPGLRPFRSDESHLFFGRESQIDTVLNRLRQNRFLAVVGSSGSGKSSLVRAGLLPALYGGLSTQFGAFWRIAVLRPGDDPIANLATALNDPEVFGAFSADELPIQMAITETVLSRGPKGLIEVVSQARLEADENVLIVVDQFEELFRFQQSSDRMDAADQAAAFVKLLVEAAQHPELPIYLLLTMRSDYLGDCTRFPDLPELMTDRQYLIPRMTREQLQRAIEGPVAVRGARMTPSLVNRLLNDVGDDPDQLPLLQHALMRTWEKWRDDNKLGNPLDIPHYLSTGGMEAALSLHADEIYDSLPSEEDRRIAELLFKCLTELASDSRGIRRPAPLREVCAVTSMPSERVIPVVDAFREPGRTFLMPGAEVGLREESMLDLSHESLMRVWDRLKRWVEEEGDSARIYRRLHQSVPLYGEAPLANPELAVDEAWLQRWQPNAAWARRYGGGFEETIAFLQRSIRAREEGEEEKRRQFRLQLQQKEQQLIEQRRRKTFYKFALIGLGSLMLFVIGLAALALGYYRRAIRAEVASFIDTSRRLTSVGEHELALREMLIAAGSVEAAKRVSFLTPIQSFFSGPALDPALELQVSLMLARQIEDFRPIKFRWFLERQSGQVYSLAFSPDGQRVASGGENNTLMLWSIGKNEPDRLVPPVRVPTAGAAVPRSVPILRSLAFSPDGQRLAVSSTDGTVYVWKLPPSGSPRLLREVLTARNNWGSLLAFNATGRWLAIASKENGEIRLVDPTGSDPDRVWSPHKERITGLSFSGDRDNPRLATASQDGRLLIWDLAGRQLAAWEGLPGRPVISFSRDGHILGIASRCKGIPPIVQFLDAEAPSRRVIASTPGSVPANCDGQPIEQNYVVASFTSSGVFSTSSMDGSLRLWRPMASHPDRIEKMATLVGDRRRFTNVRLSPDGRRFVSSSPAGSTITVRRVGDLCQACLPGGEGPFTALRFTSDGLGVGAVNAHGSVFHWDLRGSATPSGTTLRGVKGPDTKLLDLTFAPAGDAITTLAATGELQRWRLGSHGGPATVAKLPPAVAARFSPDGQQVATLLEGASAPSLWTIAGVAGKPLRPPAAAPDEETVGKGATQAAGASGPLAFSRQPLTLFLVPDQAPTQRRVWSWTLPGGKPQAPLVIPSDPPSALERPQPAFTIANAQIYPRTRTMLTANTNGTVGLWDLQKQFKALVPIDTDWEALSAVAVRDDGRSVALAGRNNRIQIFSLDLDSLADQGCKVLRESLVGQDRASRLVQDLEVCSSPRSWLKALFRLSSS